MCVNFIAEMIIKSKIMKSIMKKLKTKRKCGRFDKKTFTYLHYLHIIEYCQNHCVKSVPIRSYSGPYFPSFEPHSLRI